MTDGLVTFSLYKLNIDKLEICRKAAGIPKQENDIWKFKMAAIFGKKNFFLKSWAGYIGHIPCGSKISTKSLFL